MVTIQRQSSRKSVILHSCSFHSAAGEKLLVFPHHELDEELHLHLLPPPPLKGPSITTVSHFPTDIITYMKQS